MKAVVALFVVSGLIGGCSYINKKAGLKNDNQIEEFCEDLIEKHTGISIDLTPEDEDGYE